MAENLGLALADLFGKDILADAELAELAASAARVQEAAPSTGGDGLSPGANLGDANLQELILLANEQYERAQTALRDGEWVEYGMQIEALQLTLEQMASLSGLDTPSGVDETQTESLDGEADESDEQAVPEDAATGT